MKKWTIPGLFLCFQQFTVFLPMVRFKLRTSGFGSDHSAKWSTTTSPVLLFSYLSWTTFSILICYFCARLMHQKVFSSRKCVEIMKQGQRQRQREKQKVRFRLSKSLRTREWEREGRVPNVLMGHSRFLFLYFIFSTFNSKHMSGIKFCC